MMQRARDVVAWNVTRRKQEELVGMSIESGGSLDKWLPERGPGSRQLLMGQLMDGR